MPTPSVQTLPRRIGAWSAGAILVGTAIGSGIFRSPAVIADRIPSPIPLLGVWVLGGILALCGALTLAELASTFPETGGIYVYIREGWGKLPAFLFGWAELVIIRAAGVGAVSIAFAEYTLRAAGYDPRIAPYNDWVHYIAASAIAVTGGLNYAGVRWGTLLQNLLTAIKCGGLLLLVVLAFAMTRAVHASASPAALGSASGITFGGVGLALISVLWVYDGWADVSFVAGEVRDPARTLPRVLIGGTLTVIAIYVLANIAYLTVLPIDVLRHSPLVAADVANRLIGHIGVVAIGITVMLSTLGTLNGSMITGPRVLWAMANDGSLFKPLAKVHPRFATPHVAIAVTSIVGIVFVMVRSFEQLADAFVTAMLPFYALAVAAVFRVRRRSGYAPPIRTIGYPITPIIFILATLALIGNSLADSTARISAGTIFVVILAGIPLYRKQR